MNPESEVRESLLDPDKKKTLITLLKWTLAGLLIRVLIMPYSMHFDLLVIDYIEDAFIRFGRLAFDPKVLGFFYPPIIYLFKIPFMLVAYWLSPEISSWLESCNGFIQNVYRARPYDNWMMFLEDVNSGIPLFRNIFLLKLYQLVCDFSIGLLLIKIVKQRSKAILLVYKLWMLNPVVLHSVFAHGQNDIIPTLLMVIALYFAYKGMRIWTLAFLLLGGMAKVFPLLLVLPFILTAEKDFTRRVKLCVAGVAIMAAMLLALHLYSGEALSGIMKVPGPMMTDLSASLVNLAKKAGFAAFYGLFLLYLFFNKQETASRSNYTASFLIPLLILYTFQPAGFRYLIWISPLVFLTLVDNRALWPIFVVQLLSLFVLRIFPQKSLQIEIFHPLYPEYFALMPNFIEVIGRVISSFWLLRLMNLLFIFTSFLLAVIIYWKNYRNSQSFLWLCAIYKYGLFIFIAGLALLFFAGMSKSNEVEKSGDRFFPVFGYSDPPDTFISIPGQGRTIDQTISCPRHEFSALDIWLEYDSSSGESDTVIARLSWVGKDSKIGHSADKAVLEERKSRGYRRFNFKNVRAAEGSPLLLEIERTGGEEDYGNGLKLGLISRCDKPRVIVKGRLVPQRAEDGTVRLVTPETGPLDYRLASTTIESRWQIALSFYIEVPKDKFQVLKTILNRLTVDRAFAVFHLSLLGLLIFGILIVGVLERRQ